MTVNISHTCLAAICDRLVMQLKVSADSFRLNLDFSFWLSSTICAVFMFDVTASWWWLMYDFDDLNTPCQWLAAVSKVVSLWRLSFFLFVFFLATGIWGLCWLKALPIPQSWPAHRTDCWEHAALIESHTCYWQVQHAGSRGQNGAWHGTPTSMLDS